MASPAEFERCFILTGPTGVGKSALALALAESLDGEIVAMDSMTLYRGLDIGTAKPTAEERSRVPHHLIDVLDPWESGSVAWWLDRAAQAVREIESRGRLAVVTGGTPLFLKALLRGLFEGPQADLDLRARLEAEEPAELFVRLMEVDIKTAQRLHPNDRKRVIRALEVWELTGKPMSELQQQWGTVGPKVVYCIERPRDELYARIDARVLEMIEAGWLDEVRRLRDGPKPLSREAMSAVGYRELFDHLAGQMELDAAIDRIQQRSRNYARRQLTWFRHLPEVVEMPAELTGPEWQATIRKENRRRG